MRMISNNYDKILSILVLTSQGITQVNIASYNRPGCADTGCCRIPMPQYATSARRAKTDTRQPLHNPPHCIVIHSAPLTLPYNARFPTLHLLSRIHIASFLETRHHILSPWASSASDPPTNRPSQSPASPASQHPTHNHPHRYPMATAAPWIWILLQPEVQGGISPI
jgi:hypothetical protein